MTPDDRRPERPCDAALDPDGRDVDGAGVRPPQGGVDRSLPPGGPTPEDDLAAICGVTIPAHVRPLLDAARRGERVMVAPSPRMGRTAYMLAEAEAAVRRGERVTVGTVDRRCPGGRPATCVGRATGDAFPTWCCAGCCTHDDWHADVTTMRGA